MTSKTLFIIMGALGIALAGLYLFIVYTEISHKLNEQRKSIYMYEIKKSLKKLLKLSGNSYQKAFKSYIGITKMKIAGRVYKSVLEQVYLEYLEETDDEICQKVLSLAYELNLPQSCLAQIRSRRNRSIAYGSRRAGLYKYAQAIPCMLKALSILSSDTQFQIIMGLARIGDVPAMIQAFEEVSRYVIINERAVFEILASFAGNKHALYKHMIHFQDEYVASLFLKAIEKDIAKDLVLDIIAILNSGGKEMRISAIKAIQKTEDNSLASHVAHAIYDPDWEVRAISAKALGTLTDLSISAPLAAALRDPEWWVRQNAATSLLSYPNCDELFLSVADTGDAYAVDSIIYVLEDSEKYELIPKLRAVAENRKRGARLEQEVLK